MNLCSPVLGTRSRASARHASILLPAFHHPTLSDPDPPIALRLHLVVAPYISQRLFRPPERTRNGATRPESSKSPPNLLQIPHEPNLPDRAYPAAAKEPKTNLIPPTDCYRTQPPQPYMLMPMSSSLHLAAGPGQQWEGLHRDVKSVRLLPWCCVTTPAVRAPCRTVDPRVRATRSITHTLCMRCSARLTTYVYRQAPCITHVKARQQWPLGQPQQCIGTSCCYGVGYP